MRVIVVALIVLFVAHVAAISALRVRRGNTIDRLKIASTMLDLCGLTAVDEYVQHARTLAEQVNRVLAGLESQNQEKAELIRWSQLLTIAGAVLIAVALIVMACQWPRCTA